VPTDIRQAISKQRLQKEKIVLKANNHKDTRKRLEQFLAAPASHFDPLRTLSFNQLTGLSDEDLVHQALQVLTIDNLTGSLRFDNSTIEMRQVILEFANNSKVRECNKIKKLLREREQDLQEISQVEKSKTGNNDDDIDMFFDSDDGGSSPTFDEPESSVQRQIQATVAGATMGKQQDRSSGKRQHKPTERFGINVAVKDKQVLYATQNRTLQQNKRLLTEPYRPPARAPKHTTASASGDFHPPQAPLITLFPENVLVESQLVSSTEDVLQQSATLNSSRAPAIVVPPIADVVDDIHQHNAAVAVSISAAPFAAYRSAIGKDGDDDDSSSTHSTTSDYGENGHYTRSSIGNTDEDDSIASHINNDVSLSDLDGHHSDLFENLFQTLPVRANNYRSPGQTLHGLHGPLLSLSRPYAPAVPTLFPHADDGVFLSQECQDATFEDIVNLLYLNWNILHFANELSDVKEWLKRFI